MTVSFNTGDATAWTASANRPECNRRGPHRRPSLAEPLTVDWLFEYKDRSTGYSRFLTLDMGFGHRGRVGQAWIHAAKGAEQPQ